MDEAKMGAETRLYRTLWVMVIIPVAFKEMQEKERVDKRRQTI